MMNRLIAAILISINALPAFAADNKLIMFKDKVSRGTDIVYMDINNVASTDKAFIFTPTNNDEDPKHYTWNASGLVYDYTPPAPVPSPKPAQFIADCTADAGIPQNMRQNLNIMALWFQLGASNVALTIWDLIKASATAPQKAAIQGHAANNNITLPN
jgi:hypothetical protein